MGRSQSAVWLEGDIDQFCPFPWVQCQREVGTSSISDGPKAYDSQKGVRVYEEICVLVGKYVPSSKVQPTVGDEGKTTPKLPPLPLSEEDALPNLGAMGKVEPPTFTARTKANSEESKDLGVESEPAPVTGFTEKHKNPPLEDSSRDIDTGLSSLDLTSAELAIGKFGSGLDVPSTETPSSVPPHVNHTYTGE